jgi:hypothetical protein
MDPNYAIQIDAYRATVAAQQAVEIEKAKAESARYAAIEAIASFGDQSTRGMALVALALSGRDGGGAARVVNVTLPSTPETADARAYKWAALFGPPLAMLAQGYFGYRLGVAQVNANRDITMSSYGALSSLGRAGFAANDGIAQSGFAAVRGVGADGFNAIGRLQPSITQIGGDGVIGSGSYSFTGPNSGAQSGNSGHIGNLDRVDSPDNPVPAPTGP